MSKVAREFQKRISGLEFKPDADLAFKRAHQNQLGVVSLPRGAPKQSRELAESKPWTGEESTQDLALRMLNDAHKPLKKQTNRQRVFSARGNAHDYKYNKEAGDTFRERLKPAKAKASSGVSTAASIDSIANQQLEDAIARGEFQSGRGEEERGKIDLGQYTMINPYIDTTEQILNRIIKKQGAAPPWILKQRAMHEQVAAFREATAAKIVTVLVHHVVEGGELSDLQGVGPLQEWYQAQQGYHECAVTGLNSVIRGYNLQAPQSARKGYLKLEQELEICVEMAVRRVPDEVDRFKGLRKIAQQQSLHKAEARFEDPSKQYGLGDMLRELFGRQRAASKSAASN